jgi:hypothetical protein
MPKSKTCEPLPKMAARRLVVSFKLCRRTNCGCGRDPKDGPYFVKRWREGGRQRKQCVPWQDLVAHLPRSNASRR